MSDDRNSDGTYKSSYVGDRQTQINAGVDWGANYSDAQQKVWEHENKQWAESQRKMRETSLPGIQPVTYTGGPISISPRFIGLLLIVAAFVFGFMMASARQEWERNVELSRYFPTSERVSLPEETGGNINELYSNIWGAMIDDKYVRPGMRSQSFNAYNHCDNSGCTRPSTKVLMQYVYPHIKPGYENQQRALMDICNLWDAQNSMEYGVQTIKMKLKPTENGCLITNYNQVKENLAMNESGYINTAVNMK
ncbi:hypothetical protein [Paraburkholderia tropica]|uniref:hypothetical protein n=1 Tax=Paraburkholderia tropica TaxID=92647 RepID=UPI003D2A37C6